MHLAHRCKFVHQLLITAVCSLTILSGCQGKKTSKTYFPELGDEALYQRSLDLRSNMSVLSIALQPGYESLADLAYFRLERGAEITSAYLTNGEAGASDVQGEYPSYLAARRRNEAAQAMSVLNGEVYFLNMPDIAAARDSSTIREQWPSDTLQARLTQLILKFKPEIVLIARDWATPGASLRWEIMCADILAAVKKCAAGAPTVTNHASPNWHVQRILFDVWQGGQITVETAKRNNLWKKSYQEIGDEAAGAYTSLSARRRLLMQGVPSSYRLVYPPGTMASSIDEGLPVPIPPRLRRLEEEVFQITAYTMEGKTSGILKRIVSLMDSLDILIARRHTMPERDRKMLLRWKKELEDLRCTALGVEVNYTISDTLLTDRQLTFLTVTGVKGVTKEGRNEIFFAPPESGWGINESIEQNLALEYDVEYRLLSPADLPHSYPPGQYEFTLPSVGKTFYFYIIHRAPSRELSFFKRLSFNVVYAPKLILENMTPVVRVTPGERVVLKLTNVSRDGFVDTLNVREPRAFAFGHALRLSSKGASAIDTLFIGWDEKFEEGSHLVPIRFGSIPVGQFLARKFPAEVAPAKRVGLITGITNSPVAETLRRLHADYSLVDVKSLTADIQKLSVLIIDQRALTLQPQIAEFKKNLEQFVGNGGHLIVLAQDAASWNAKPLWDGMQLTSTLGFDASTPVEVVSSDPLLTTPNQISTADWDEWLFQRGYNVVSGPALGAALLPVKTGGHPLIVSLREGEGRKTYVDLALYPQLLNIHAGTFRLLANLISY